jgi:uncharacterized membrane protein
VNPVQSIDFDITGSSHEEIGFLAQSRRCRNLWIVGLALIALMLKLVIAFNTVGTNDAVSFYGFAKVLSQHGLEWAYRHIIYLNHPPLIAYYLRGIYTLTEQPWCQDVGVHFPFLLRLPGIIADFLVVLVLLRITKTDLRIPTWALALFALSPVSLMVSGFHGNTDPVMVMFLMLAAYMCLRDRPLLCAIFFALSCQIKIIPLLLLPILFFFWLSRQAALRFTIPFILLTVAMWIQPLIGFPMLFLRNVIGYSSYWGGWGITYWLRLSHWGQFNGTGAFHLPPAAAASAFALKCSIAAAVLLLAWRRRLLDGRGAIDSIAYAWMIFFVFSPGICAQYMVWIAPFSLLLSPSFYAWVTATSSLFLFAFYNAIAGGLPWYLAISSNNLEKIDLWAPWSLWPWATLILGLVLLWKKAIITDSSLRLFSVRTLDAQSA